MRLKLGLVLLLLVGGGLVFLSRSGRWQSLQRAATTSEKNETERRDEEPGQRSSVAESQDVGVADQATKALEREPAPTEDTKFSGQVAALDGSPLSGARVSWTAWDKKDVEWEPAWQLDDWGALARLARETATDGHGRFSFDEEVFGEHGTVLWATHEDHESACVLLEPDQELTPASATLRLQPLPGIRVRVVDAAGDPVAGAIVEQYGLTASRASRGSDGRTQERARRLLARRYTTDSTGTTRCGPFVGEQILVAHQGTQRSIPWRGVRQDEVLLRLGDSFTIGGSVAFPDWSHLGYEGERRIVVRARLGDDLETLVSSRPTLDGEWGPLSVPLIQGAEFSLELAGSPIVPLIETFLAPAAGGHVTLDLFPELGHSLAFFIQDEEGNPLGDAQVASYWHAGEYERVLRRRAESDGHAFNWSLPSEVEVRTFVTAPGFAGQWCYPILLPENPPATHRIILTKGAVLQGRCTHAGQPVPDFEVVVWVSGRSTETQVARSFKGREDGRFEMDGVPEGRLQVTAGTASLPFCRPALVELPSTQAIEIELFSPTLGTGQVVDLETSGPLEGARVQVLTVTAENVIRPWGAVHRTDGEGRFSIPGFLPGRNMIRVQADGFAERDVPAFSRGPEDVDFGRIGLDRRQLLTIQLVTDEGPVSIAGMTAQGSDGTLLPRKPFDASGVARFEDVDPGTRFLLLEGAVQPSWTFLRLHLERGRKWSFTHKVAGRRRLHVEVTGENEQRPSYRGLAVTYVNRDGVTTESGVPFPVGGGMSLDGIDADSALVTIIGATSQLPLFAVADLEGEDLHARLDLEGRPLVLRVVDREGVPIPGVAVRLGDAGPAAYFILGATDGGGRCEFRGLAGRQLLVSLDHESRGRRIGIPVDGGAGEVELVLSATGRLDLRIRDGAEPIAGVQAKALVTPVGPRWNYFGTSDEEGAILVSDLGEGSYRVLTEHPECWPAAANVTATASPAACEIQVRRRGGLVLQVRTPDGFPVRALPVELVSEEFGADVGAWIDEGTVTSRAGLVSDAKGEIRIERLPRGPYRYRVRTPAGEERVGRGEVLAGKLVSLPIVLP